MDVQAEVEVATKELVDEESASVLFKPICLPQVNAERQVM